MLNPSRRGVNQSRRVRRPPDETEADTFVDECDLSEVQTRRGRPRACHAADGISALAGLEQALSEDTELPYVGVGARPVVSGEARPEDEFVGSAYQPHPDSPRPGVFTPDWVLQVTDDCAERFVLGQLAYLSGVKRDGKLRTWVHRDGYHWVRITYRKLGHQVHLSKRRVMYAVRKLRAKAVLITLDDGAAGHLLHLRIDPLAVESALPARDQTEEVEDEDALL